MGSIEVGDRGWGRRRRTMPLVSAAGPAATSFALSLVGTADTLLVVESAGHVARVCPERR